MPIADKCRRLAFMPQILTPNFPFLRGAADALTKASERVSKAVRFGVGKPSACESVAENPPNRSGSAPRVSGQSLSDEPTIFASTDLRRWEKRVVIRKT